VCGAPLRRRGSCRACETVACHSSASAKQLIHVRARIILENEEALSSMTYKPGEHPVTWSAWRCSAATFHIRRPRARRHHWAVVCSLPEGQTQGISPSFSPIELARYRPRPDLGVFLIGSAHQRTSACPGVLNTSRQACQVESKPTRPGWSRGRYAARRQAAATAPRSKQGSSFWHGWQLQAPVGAGVWRRRGKKGRGREGRAG
jgi:hypothetical protein